MSAGARLGLGTVQWGLPYGISNAAGQTQRHEVGAILAEARTQGVAVLDTASLYGEAEAVLGESVLDGFRVVTKTPAFASANISAAQVEALASTFQRSLERLSCERIYGLLLHRADDLCAPGGDGLVRAMEALKAQGQVSRIGVSVYDGEQLDRVLRVFRPDIVQLPLSVLDQRLLRSGHLELLKRSGVEIHVRSVFLQGLLLMPVERVPAFFDPVRPLLARWHTAVAARGLTPTQAALAFVRDLAAVDVVLVGVENARQLSQCVTDFTSAEPFDGSELACDDARYVNPMNWEAS